MSDNFQRVFFVRHGQTDWNLNKRMQGRADTELNELGKKQASYLPVFFEKICVPDVVVSSPLKRAKYTALQISNSFDLPIIEKDGLMEVDVGVCQGLVPDEAEKKYHNIRAAFLEDNPIYDSYRYENGEDKIEVRSRMSNEVEGFLSSNTQYNNIVFVSHGFALSQMLIHINKKWDFYKKFSNCAIYEALYDYKENTWTPIGFIYGEHVDVKEISV